MNLAKNLETSAFYFPQRPAVSEDGKETRYALLNERANRVATALLKAGFDPGDHVALCAPNSGDWLAFYFGVIKMGATAVTLSSQLKADELTLLVNHCRPKAIFTFDEKLGDLEKLRGDDCLETIICPGGDLSFDRLLDTGESAFRAVDCERTDTAAILYTGGTTGTPKGVMLSHENITTAVTNVVFNERSTETDRALCFLPFNHVFAQMHIMNATMLSGGCVELIPAFDLETVLAITAAGNVTKLFGVPTVYVRLLSVEDLKQQLGAVRYCFSAAASMAVELVRQWQQRTGLAVHEAYGMTESASMVTYNHYYRHVIGSVGSPVGTTEVRICNDSGQPVRRGDEGEICIRGRNIMTGYLNHPEETRKAFWGDWFRSGDIGRIDQRGHLFIVDRLKDMIITGGENVYSTEVEEVLYTFPDIQECAVIGTPDKEWGESVTAFILPKPGIAIEEKGLKTFLKDRLSTFKVPKRFFTVDDFPRSPAGKVLKRELRKTFLKSERLN